MPDDVTLAESQPVGTFYSWWRGDPLPDLSEIDGLEIASHAQDGDLPDLTADDVRQQSKQGHQLYLARLAGMPVGYGWLATTAISIGELGVERPLPTTDRYLWGFVTVVKQRGRGIYPRLIQAMLRHEPAERFWIGHDTANIASGRGILKAGCTPVGEVFVLTSGELRLVPAASPERAAACAQVFGISLAAD